MAANLEEPGRSRSLHIIHQALQDRNQTPPRPNIPLTVPFLGDEPAIFAVAESAGRVVCRSVVG